jgi:hypothetical protein
VTPQISSVSPVLLNLGNGVQAPVFNQQIIDTTVVAQDGETVAIGGLIVKTDSKSEDKIPWFGDLPYLGAMFSFRTQSKQKRELLVVLTPRIVRNRLEADRILAEESRRMAWIVGDVMKIQGPTGMEPLFPQPPGGAALPPPVDAPLPAPLTPGRPFEPTLPTPRTGTGPAPAVPTIPPSPSAPPTAPVPAPTSAGPAVDRPLAGMSLLPAAPTPVPANPPVVTTSATMPAAAAAPAQPVHGGKESDRWRLFRTSR